MSKDTPTTLERNPVTNAEAGLAYALSVLCDAADNLDLVLDEIRAQASADATAPGAISSTKHLRLLETLTSIEKCIFIAADAVDVVKDEISAEAAP